MDKIYHKCSPFDIGPDAMCIEPGGVWVRAGRDEIERFIEDRVKPDFQNFSDEKKKDFNLNAEQKLLEFGLDVDSKTSYMEDLVKQSGIAAEAVQKAQNCAQNTLDNADRAAQEAQKAQSFAENAADYANRAESAQSNASISAGTASEAANNAADSEKKARDFATKAQAAESNADSCATAASTSASHAIEAQTKAASMAAAAESAAHTAQASVSFSSSSSQAAFQSASHAIEAADLSASHSQAASLYSSKAQEYADTANKSANSAVDMAISAQNWAIGSIQTVPQGSAKYWAEQSAAALADLPCAGETEKGVVYLATDMEAAQGEHSLHVMTPATTYANYVSKAKDARIEGKITFQKKADFEDGALVKTLSLDSNSREAASTEFVRSFGYSGDGFNAPDFNSPIWFSFNAETPCNGYLLIELDPQSRGHAALEINGISVFRYLKMDDEILNRHISFIIPVAAQSIVTYNECQVSFFGCKG